MEHLDATAVLQLHYVETRQLVGCILLEIRRLNKFMFGELSGSIFGRFKICKYSYKSAEMFFRCQNQALRLVCLRRISTYLIITRESLRFWGGA